MGSRFSAPNRTVEPESEDALDDDQTTFGPDRTETERELEDDCNRHADDRAITDNQGKTIDERREGLEGVVEDKLDVVESHQYGSHSRGTMTGPLTQDSDADVMFVLSDEERRRYLNDENGARNVLQKMKRAIENDPRYANTEVSIDRNVVAVKFNDFTVEATPAFRDGSGGYHIPDTYQKGRSWVRTNPRQYKNMFEATNEARGGRPQKLARIAKDYNDRSGNPVSSYHMEVMAYQYARSQPRDQPTDKLVDGFFERLPSKIRQGTNEPVYGDRIDRHMSSDAKHTAVKKAQKARKHVRRARKEKEKGNTEAAREEYREVMGDDFG